MGDIKHAEASGCERHRRGAEESAAEFVDLAWHDESPDRKRTLSTHCRLEQRQISGVEFPGNGEADSSPPKRSEGGRESGRQDFGLLPCGEMAALVDFPEVGQVAICAPRPCFRGSIDVLGKYRDCHGERDLGGFLRGRQKNALAA